jgi:hypothetical protein
MFFQSDLKKDRAVRKAMNAPTPLEILCTPLIKVQSTVNEAEFDVSQMNE